jgi:hypothetical protein
MPDLELTRIPGERRLYSLGGLGTLRLEGLAGRSATAEANGRSWRISRRGLLGRGIVAADAAGRIAGEFRPERMRRGGALTWGGRERYALAEGDHELAVFDGRGWSRRPVRVTVADLAAVDVGLLLFAAFVVRGLAEEANATAGSVAASGAATAAAVS